MSPEFIVLAVVAALKASMLPPVAASKTAKCVMLPQSAVAVGKSIADVLAALVGDSAGDCKRRRLSCVACRTGADFCAAASVVLVRQ